MVEPQESIFRVLNERIRLLVTTFRGFEEEAVPFVCECDQDTCFAPVELSLVDYEGICSSDRRVVSPGHVAEPASEIQAA
jgi:hypothetical protein